MEPDTTAATSDPSAVLYHWSARRLQPIVLFYVALVFGAFIVLAWAVFHSMTAVKALAVAAAGGVVPLVPMVVSRFEFQLTETGLERRALHKSEPGDFKELFRWDQLGRIVPVKSGFKFYKPLNETNAMRRFWNNHVSTGFSGEVQVEAGDRERVLRLVEEHTPPTSSPA